MADVPGCPRLHHHLGEIGQQLDYHMGLNHVVGYSCAVWMCADGGKRRWMFPSEPARRRDRNCEMLVTN
jgi:hypothetical protein